MKTLMISQDGQIALPDLALRHLGAIPGDRLEIVASPLGEVRLRLTKAMATALVEPDLAGKP